MQALTLPHTFRNCDPLTTSSASATNMQNSCTTEDINDVASLNDFSIRRAFLSTNLPSSQQDPSIVSYPPILSPRAAMSLRNLLDVVNRALEIVDDDAHWPHNKINEPTNCKCSSPVCCCCSRGGHSANGRFYDRSPKRREEDRPSK
jgi:hypothetical protein